MIMGIDLAMRTSGVTLLSSDVQFRLIKCSSDQYKDEDVMIYNWQKIKELILEFNPEHIVIEGLSYDSISGSKDIIAGNFWYIRTRIKIEFPDINVHIVSVKSWREPLFNKSRILANVPL